MDKIKVAVIGTGGISNEHINAYLKNPNVELYAFCDINEKQLNMMAEKMKISAIEAHQEALKYIKTIRSDVNSQLSSFSRISEVKLQEEPFARTPTQKIKRFLYPGKKDKEGKDNDDK